MSNTAEDVLFASLTDIDALEVLAKEGLDLEVIPTEEMRPVVEWAIEWYFRNDRKTAPSRAALLNDWGQVIEDAEIELLPENEEHDSIEWAIGALKAQSVHYQFQTFLKESSTAMSKAPPTQRIATLAVQASNLYSLSLKMQSQKRTSTLSTGMPDRLHAYEQRAAEQHSYKGMTFGLPMVDEHTYGIHAGEVAIVAAGPKTGKSFFMADTGYHEAAVNGRTTVLFTLENSVEMTMDRIACRALHIDAHLWQRGQCTEAEVEQVRSWINDVLPFLKAELHIVMPEPGHRTMAAMYRTAVLLGAQSMIIDQLTFVDHPEPRQKNRQEIIRDMMHDIKERASSSDDEISVLIAHQINREGMKAAEKSGHLEMYHLAEASEIERTADWVFGLYRSQAQRLATQAQLQVMAARREDLQTWDLHWDTALGDVGVIGVQRGVE